MRIGILSTFYDWDRAYSLVSVVEEQLKSLLENGYEAVLFVHDNFNDDLKVPKGVEIRKVIPRFRLVDYTGNQPVEPGFEEQTKKVKEALEEHLKDIDVVLTHDWIFQGWFLVYNIGMRLAQPNLKCRWLHWIHSAPSPRPNDLKAPHDSRYKTMPNSKLIYMNNYDTLRLAEMYGATIDDVRVVHNPLDPRTFYNFDPFVCELIRRFNILDADVVQVYPVSSTRFQGKQTDKVLRVLAEIKKQGKSVRFICTNAHANGSNEKLAIDDLIRRGIDFGLSRSDIIFTSLESKQYEVGVPKEIVSQLFLLSNLFVFPTLSENGPLILLEAALSKCLLVLNESFAPLREFFGENALYFKFGSLIENVRYSDEDKWYRDVAMIIIGELNKNRPLNAFTKLKQKFNRQYTFKNQLEPLFWEKF
jgi:hypothetical protein